MSEGLGELKWACPLSYIVKNYFNVIKCQVSGRPDVIIIRVLKKETQEAGMRILSDSEKLEQLFDLYEKSMYGTAFRILRNEGQAEDAVQDAFLRIMSHLKQIKAPDSSETKQFMVRIIKSAAIDIYRKNQREWAFTVFDPEDVQKNQMAGSDRSLDTIEDRQVIQRALMALDKKYREVLELKCYFGLSHREIALLLEISEDAAAKRYERAKKIALKMIGDGACA